MPLNASGPISIGGATAGQSINLEFGRSATAQTSMSQLYRNGGIVGAGAPNVPTSGQISLSQFYGAANAYTFTQTISSPTTNYNLRSAAVAAGWPTGIPLNATVTINSGVTVYSTSTGTPAFQTGSPFPSGSTLAVINNGVILGRGGPGGPGQSFGPPWGGPGPANPGSSGGPGFTASAAVSVTNNNRIAGGGGGGGGGGFYEISQEGGNRVVGGGGGGGGIGNGPGGPGGTISGLQNFTNGTPGKSGSLTSAGGITYTANPPSSSTYGGAGGTYGSSGQAGTAGQPGSVSFGGGGGAAGAAVTGNSNITWVATGTRNGPIS